MILELISLPVVLAVDVMSRGCGSWMVTHWAAHHYHLCCSNVITGRASALQILLIPVMLAPKKGRVDKVTELAQGVFNFNADYSHVNYRLPTTCVSWETLS